ncbi:hypothetical protein, partial [Ruegeria sp.]|uniref:hypothetical protein n=1 Tax=Ruegeria sp. TaxID=1879320 RepID=UPI00232507F0
MTETTADTTQSSSALECLVLVSRFLGVELSRSAIVTQLPQIARATCPPEVLLKAAETHGLCGEVSSVTWSAMRRMVRAMPFIGQLSNGEFIIIAGITPAANEGEHGPVVLVQDPQATSLELLRVPVNEFRKRWSGRLILLRKLDDANAPIAPYDFKWIFSEVGKFKGILLEVGLISLFIHGVSFITAIFTMIVFDKVIGYEGLATLHTLFA